MGLRNKKKKIAKFDEISINERHHPIGKPSTKLADYFVSSEHRSEGKS